MSVCIDLANNDVCFYTDIKENPECDRVSQCYSEIQHDIWTV